MYVNKAIDNYLASAGDIGGMMGKKFGLGWSRAFPVIRQNEDIFVSHFFLVYILTIKTLRTLN